jgi:Zn-finger nucleic acid-binding protein
MKCPACRKPLVVVERESIEVDWCPSCHGVWFDAGELELLAGKAGKRLEPGLIGTPAGKIEEALRRCPRCRHKMEKVAPTGDKALVLDRCVEHGLWFDAGELSALMRRLADRAGEEAAVIGFLNETFSHSPAGGNKVPIKESST